MLYNHCVCIKRYTLKMYLNGRYTLHDFETRFHMMAYICGHVGSHSSSSSRFEGQTVASLLTAPELEL